MKFLCMILMAISLSACNNSAPETPATDLDHTDNDDTAKVAMPDSANLLNQRGVNTDTNGIQH